MYTAKNAMSAFAAIQNPLADNSTDPEAWLFCMTDNCNFYVQRRLADTPDPCTSFNIPPGSLTNPSTFGALRYNNAVEAYGLVKDSSATSSDACCSQSYSLFAISPYMRDLKVATDIPTIAACGDGEDNGWIYYIKTNDDKSIGLNELQLAGLTPNSWNSPVPLATSYLAACYDPKKQNRYVFYQGKANVGKGQKLKYFTSNGQVVAELDKSDDVKKGNSPLTCCLFAGADGGSKIALYYVDDYGALKRTTYDITKNTWTESSGDQMNTAPPVDQTSQLTCMTDMPSKKIRVYYIDANKTSNGFACWEDEFEQA